MQASHFWFPKNRLVLLFLKEQWWSFVCSKLCRNEDLPFRNFPAARSLKVFYILNLSFVEVYHTTEHSSVGEIICLLKEKVVFGQYVPRIAHTLEWNITMFTGWLQCGHGADAAVRSLPLLLYYWQVHSGCEHRDWLSWLILFAIFLDFFRQV
jgi:hypothetical protein